MKKISIILGIVLIFALGAFIWMTGNAKKALDAVSKALKEDYTE